MKKIFLYAIISGFLFFAVGYPLGVLAHQPRIIYSQAGDIQIKNPELSQAFYDELTGKPREYFIDSAKDFELYLNLLVPAGADATGKYSADVFDVQGKKLFSLDGPSFIWQEFYEPFGRDYYLKGPELTERAVAGKYKIEVFSADNQGKYVLAVGQKESFDIPSILNIYWQLPLLKVQFFKTDVLQFLLTPFGIAGIGAVGGFLVLLALIYYLVGFVRQVIKHNQAKTLLLTSSGMQSMRDEIIKLLQKPAEDVEVAFITTAAKPQQDIGYVKRDWTIMKEELGFNVEEIDIEGKTEHQVEKMLEFHDIIYVEGGNTFYLLKAMRECNFEKIIRKFLKEGKVYIGVSAGSIVAGKTIKTAGWKNADKNIVHLRDLKGLNLVGFDIFVHYQPEHAEIIKKEMPDAKKRAKNLRILTDEQAILVQGKEVDLIGDGEAIVV